MSRLPDPIFQDFLKTTSLTISINKLALVGFPEALQSGDYQFLQTIQNLPEHNTMPWYLWYLEYLLVSGQWITLTEHLAEQRAFDRQGLTEEIF